MKWFFLLGLIIISSCTKHHPSLPYSYFPHYNQVDTVDDIQLSGYQNSGLSYLGGLAFLAPEYVNGVYVDSTLYLWDPGPLSSIDTLPFTHPSSIQYLGASPLIVLDSLKYNDGGYFRFAINRHMLNKPIFTVKRIFPGSNSTELIVTYVLGNRAEVEIFNQAYLMPFLNDTLAVSMYNAYLAPGYLSSITWAWDWRAL